MCWDFAVHTEQLARKDYRCQASDWINSGYCELDFDPEDWQAIMKAKGEGWKILKGTNYLKVKGKWEGEFCVFRARPELDAICHKYDLYEC